MHQQTKKVLIFAGLHPLEWVGIEAAVDSILTLIEYPPKNVEVVVVQISLSVQLGLLVILAFFNVL